MIIPSPGAAHHPLPEGEGILNPSPSGRGVGVRGSLGKSLPLNKGLLPADLLSHARELRARSTDAEQLMWYLLRNRNLLGCKFRRQHSVRSYILDFYCTELRIAVELDGGQHNLESSIAIDEKRSADLSRIGIEIVRYWNHDVLNQVEVVLQDLMSRLAMRKRPLTPAPLPEGEGFTGSFLT